MKGIKTTTMGITGTFFYMPTNFIKFLCVINLKEFADPEDCIDFGLTVVRLIDSQSNQGMGQKEHCCLYVCQQTISRSILKTNSNTWIQHLKEDEVSLHTSRPHYVQQHYINLNRSGIKIIQRLTERKSYRILSVVRDCQLDGTYPVRSFAYNSLQQKEPIETIVRLEAVSPPSSSVRITGTNAHNGT